MYNNQEIALKIKQAAKDKKISIKQLLENCNLNVNYISQFANGRDMTASNLYSIANHLGVSIDYLLGRTENPQGVNQINTGNVGSHSRVNVHNEKKTTDSDGDDTISELVAVFKTLSFCDKAKVMGLIAELSEK